MSQTNSNHTHNLHRVGRIRTACPNPEAAVYCSGKGCSSLTVERLLGRLAKLNMSVGSPVMRQAAALAGPINLDPFELLHRAIARAVRPNTRRPNIKLIPYLTMQMRSIASSVARARLRAANRGDSMIPFDLVAEQVPDTRSIVDPFQTLIREHERAFFERVLGSVVTDDCDLENLVDLIDRGARGKDIEEALNIDTLKLAALRKRLKRRARSAVERAYR